MAKINKIQLDGTDYDIRGLIPEVVQSLPATGDEDTLYLVEAAEPGTKSAELTGSTVSINDAPDGAPFALDKLNGNATQKTLSGKNLFGFTDGTLTLYDVLFTINGTDVSAKGVSSKASYAQNTNLIGGLVSNGNYPAYTNVTADNSLDLAAGTYTLSATITNSGNTQAGLYIGVGTVGSGISSGEKLSATGSKTVTLASGQRLYISVWYEGNASASNVDFKATNIQLEAGATATAYEPFCGGTPAPNPDFPQAVNTVTGGQTVKITGKNILPTITGSATQSDVSLTSTDGNITASGIATANVTFTLTGTDGITYRQAYWQTITASATNSVELQKGTYYLSATATLGNISAQFRLVDLGQKLEDGTSISLNSSFTITEPKRLCITIYVNNGNTPNVNISNLQLELGTQASQFEPYQSQSYEINLGKNLLNIPDGTYSDNGITATVADGKITLTGTATATSFVAINIPPITLDSAWSFSLNNTVYGDSNTQIRLYEDDGTSYVGITSNVANAKSESRTNHGTYNKVQIRTSSGVVAGGATAQPQVELGAQATPYAPYKTPIELCKIGTYQDYIWNDDGTWKIHEAVGKFTLDGTQPSTSYIARTNTFRAIFQSGITGLSSASADNKLSKSEKFTDDTGIWGNDREGFYVDNANVVVSANISTVGSTIGSMKTWFQSNPTKFYTPLATPTDTEITDTELVAQLDALLGGTLFEGTSNIFLIPAGGAQGTMELHATMYDPERRYDEYVWVDDDQSYELVGAAALEVDDFLSLSSLNPVQNRTLTEIIGDVESILQILNNGNGV